MSSILSPTSGAVMKEEEDQEEERVETGEVPVKGDGKSGEDGEEDLFGAEEKENDDDDNDEEESPKSLRKQVERMDNGVQKEDKGEGDNDKANDDDDDEEEDRVVGRNRRRRVDSPLEGASPSASISESPGLLPRESPLGSPADTPAEKEEDYADLEHRETSAEPVMGSRPGQVGAEDQGQDINEAQFFLPSLPIRRGADHYFARLPNLVQYRSEVFDRDTFDEVNEDDLLKAREGFRIDDVGLRSLLTTNNTVRWRWTDEQGEGASEPTKEAQSNARVVRWSDGSSSLQLGSEFYDISETKERGERDRATGEVQPPKQHLTHMFVKHEGQEKLNVYQAEAPILATMTLRPSSTASESHQRLARAVRHQKSTLVKEAQLGMDPELEKERLEREEKKRGQKRAREIKKRRVAGGAGEEDADDDAFWANVSKSRRSGLLSNSQAGPTLGGTVADDEPMEGVDDDGFVVDDEIEGAEDAEGSDEEQDAEGEDEPDEMELMEQEIERADARRKADRAAGKSDAEAFQGEAKAGDENVLAGVEGDDKGIHKGRRRVVDSDEDE